MPIAILLTLAVLAACRKQVREHNRFSFGGSGPGGLLNNDADVSVDPSKINADDIWVTIIGARPVPLGDHFRLQIEVEPDSLPNYYQYVICALNEEGCYPYDGNPGEFFGFVHHVDDGPSGDISIKIRGCLQERLALDPNNLCGPWAKTVMSMPRSGDADLKKLLMDANAIHEENRRLCRLYIQELEQLELGLQGSMSEQERLKMAAMIESGELQCVLADSSSYAEDDDGSLSAVQIAGIGILGLGGVMLAYGVYRQVDYLNKKKQAAKDVSYDQAARNSPLAQELGVDKPRYAPPPQPSVRVSTTTSPPSGSSTVTSTSGASTSSNSTSPASTSSASTSPANTGSTSTAGGVGTSVSASCAFNPSRGSASVNGNNLTLTVTPNNGCDLPPADDGDDNPTSKRKGLEGIADEQKAKALVADEKNLQGLLEQRKSLLGDLDGALKFEALNLEQQEKIAAQSLEQENFRKGRLEGILDDYVDSIVEFDEGSDSIKKVALGGSAEVDLQFRPYLSNNLGNRSFDQSDLSKSQRIKEGIKDQLRPLFEMDLYFYDVTGRHMEFGNIQKLLDEDPAIYKKQLKEEFSRQLNQLQNEAEFNDPTKRGKLIAEFDAYLDTPPPDGVRSSLRNPEVDKEFRNIAGELGPKWKGVDDFLVGEKAKERLTPPDLEPITDKPLTLTPEEVERVAQIKKDLDANAEALEQEIKNKQTDFFNQFEVQRQKLEKQIQLNDQLEARNAQVKEALQTAKDDLEAARKKLESAEQKGTLTEAERQRLQDAESKVADLERANRTLSIQLEGAQSKIAVQIQQIQPLKEKIASLEESLNSLSDENKALQESISKLQKDKLAKGKEISSLQEQLQNAKDADSVSQEKIESITKKLEQLTLELQEVTIQEATLKSLNSQQEVDIAKLNNEISGLKEANATLNNQVSQLQGQIAEHDRQIEIKNKELQELDERLKAQGETVEQLRKDYKNATDELSAVKGGNIDLQKKVLEQTVLLTDAEIEYENMRDYYIDRVAELRQEAELRDKKLNDLEIENGKLAKAVKAKNAEIKRINFLIATYNVDEIKLEIGTPASARLQSLLDYQARLIIEQRAQVQRLNSRNFFDQKAKERALEDLNEVQEEMERNVKEHERLVDEIKEKLDLDEEAKRALGIDEDAWAAKSYEDRIKAINEHTLRMRDENIAALQSQKDALKQTQDEVVNLKLQQADLKSQLASSQQKNTQLENRLALVERQLTDALEKLEGADSKVSGLTFEIEDLKNQQRLQLEEMESYYIKQIDDLENYLDKLYGENLDESRARIEDLEQKLKQLQSERQSFIDRNNLLSDQLTAERSQYEEQIRKLNERIDNLEQVKGSNDAEVESLKQQVQDLESQSRAVDAENFRLRDQLTRMQTQQQADMDRLNTRLSEISSNAADSNLAKEAEIRRLNNEIEMLKTQPQTNPRPAGPDPVVGRTAAADSLSSRAASGALQASGGVGFIVGGIVLMSIGTLMASGATDVYKLTSNANANASSEMQPELVPFKNIDQEFKENSRRLKAVETQILNHLALEYTSD